MLIISFANWLIYYCCRCINFITFSLNCLNYFWSSAIVFLADAWCFAYYTESDKRNSLFLIVDIKTDGSGCIDFIDYCILSFFLSLIDTVSISRLLFNPAKDELDLYRDLSNTLDSRIDVSFKGVNFFLETVG